MTEREYGEWSGTVRCQGLRDCVVRAVPVGGERADFAPLFPASLEIKGRVAFDATHRFIRQVVDKSRTRAVTAAVCGPDPAADNSAFNDKAVAALASQYGKRERCGVAEPITGVLEVYFIPRGKLADKLMTSLARKSKAKLRGKGDMLMVAVHKRGIGPDAKPLPAEQPRVPHAADPLPTVPGGRGTPPPNVSSGPRTDDRPGAEDIQDLLNQVNSQFGGAHPPAGMPPPLAPPPPIGGGLNVMSGPLPDGPPPPPSRCSPPGRRLRHRAPPPPDGLPPGRRSTAPPPTGTTTPAGAIRAEDRGPRIGAAGPRRGGRLLGAAPAGSGRRHETEAGTGVRGSAGPRPAGGTIGARRRRGTAARDSAGRRAEVSGAAAPRGVGTGPHPDQGVPIPTDTAGHRPRRGTIAGTAETGAAQSGGTSFRPRDGTKVASREHYRRTLSQPRTRAVRIFLLSVITRTRSPPWTTFVPRRRPRGAPAGGSPARVPPFLPGTPHSPSYRSASTSWATSRATTSGISSGTSSGTSAGWSRRLPRPPATCRRGAARR